MTYIQCIGCTFDFGKYRYYAFLDVVMYHPSYLIWLLENVSGDIFFVAPRVMEQMRYMCPSFVFTKDLLNYYAKRKQDFEAFKIEEDMRIEKEKHRRWSWEEYERQRNERYWEEPPTYEKYRGTYAQDAMGYSDDEIDTIFDGDPSAYWNID